MSVQINFSDREMAVLAMVFRDHITMPTLSAEQWKAIGKELNLTGDAGRNAKYAFTGALGKIGYKGSKKAGGGQKRKANGKNAGDNAGDDEEEGAMSKTDDDEEVKDEDEEMEEKPAKKTKKGKGKGN